ncbi:SPOR domain-containing protein [Castellaniella sp.]|uniref:SPOR domain-containing protein n=1 Tax=Castellaniella sp. TaxID=1955812 RepID=UPI003567E2F4
MFFRKKPEAERRSASRGGAAEAARIKELRIQARRRLVGALVLVLTAFILVTWLFDEPVSEPAPAPIIVPAPPSGLPSGDEFSAISEPDDAPAPDTASGAITTLAEPSGESPPGEAAPGTEAPPAQQAAEGAETRVPVPEGSQADSPPSSRNERSPASAAAAADTRTDDGSVALALLAGKTPPTATPPAAAASGRYYLQVAAYATEQDAIKRRDSLHQAGVSNAYVETAQSGGRTVHRLRVGPFSSHEAAQAAQTRLRALGYENGLIAGQ